MKLLELMSFTPLVCKGRPCLKCKKCRDWYYDGEKWRRRIGYTCTDYILGDNRPVGDAPGMVGRHVGGLFGGGGDFICQCRQ